MKNLNRKLYFGKIGVYRIYNLSNDKCYIGSSVNLYKRISGHISNLKKNKSDSIKLQNYCNKYGIDALKVEILELCDKEILLNREAFYIHKFDSVSRGFNCLGNVTSPFYCTFSEERKQTLRDVWKVYKIIYREKLLQNLEKARKSLKDNPINQIVWNKGLSTSEETKRKQSESAKRRGLNYYKPVVQYTKDETKIEEFTSAREAERCTKVKYQNISKCCLGERKTAGGFIWKFK